MMAGKEAEETDDDEWADKENGEHAATRATSDSDIDDNHIYGVQYAGLLYIAETARKKAASLKNLSDEDFCGEDF
jgi:hypothetical protein